MVRGYRKCMGCKESFPNDIMKPFDGKYYCPSCAKEKAEESKNSSLLRKYLYNLCDKDQYVMAYLSKQVNRMQADPDCSYSSTGILATLKYVFDTSENPPTFSPEYGIEGLVIQNYPKAIKYYKELKELNKFPEIEIDQTLLAPEKEIHINKNYVDEKNRQFINRMKDREVGPLIDLNSIADEVEEEDNEQI